MHDPTLATLPFPTLILIAGGPGAGKTSLGRALAASMPATVLLDKDVLATGWVDAMLERLNQGQVDRDSDVYWKTVRPLEYAALTALALDNLALGKSVIVVAPFLAELADPEWKPGLVARLDEHGARLKVLWVQTDPASARIRMTLRRDPRDAWKLGHWDRFLETARFLPPADDLFVLVNTEQAALVDLLNQAHAYLNNP